MLDCWIPANFFLFVAIAVIYIKRSYTAKKNIEKIESLKIWIQELQPGPEATQKEKDEFNHNIYVKNLKESPKMEKEDYQNYLKDEKNYTTESSFKKYL
jgi:hypothetical protein